MVWFKVDDNLAFHRKTMLAGTAAMGLWVRAGAWCMHTLTDGFVPEHMVPALSDGEESLAKHLVKSGLWVRVPGGFLFHEWEERQPSRDEVVAKSKVRAEAGRKGGLKSGQVRGSQGSKPEANASTDEEANGEAESTPDLNPDPARSVPARTDLEVQEISPRPKTKRGTRIPKDFDATPDMIEWKRQNTPDVNGRLETQKFIDYWTAESGQRATKTDWVAAWRNWMRKAQETSAPRKNGNSYRSQTDANIEAFMNPEPHLRAIAGSS